MSWRRVTRGEALEILGNMVLDDPLRRVRQVVVFLDADGHWTRFYCRDSALGLSVRFESPGTHGLTIGPRRPTGT